jgi:hypothetical protein
MWVVGLAIWHASLPVKSCREAGSLRSTRVRNPWKLQGLGLQMKSSPTLLTCKSAPGRPARSKESTRSPYEEKFKGPEGIIVDVGHRPGAAPLDENSLLLIACGDETEEQHGKRQAQAHSDF